MGKEYLNSCKQIIISVGDYVLTRDYRLLKVKKIYVDGIITHEDLDIPCSEIIDVKKWEESNDYK